MSALQPSVVLRDTRDADGWRFLVAHVDDQGDLVLTGSDGGPGVAAAFGSGVSEYEWTGCVPAADIPAALALVGEHGKRAALTVLRRLVKEQHVEEWLRAVREARLLRLTWNHHST